MPVAQIDEYKVLEIKTLGKARDAEARQLLERVAKQVQPIMRKRQWTVCKLSEFVPRSPNLLGLNVNRGQEVKIRLRPAGRESSFYDWNHVLGTMLHELCHNRIGPHNAEFYKLLDELWNEAEELMDKGLTGTAEGFDGPSAGRLGAHSFIPIHNPPEHKMADAIRKAAEARARQQALMPSGPCKLGGSSSYKHMTPAQAAAAAAERRARDNLWCGAEYSAEEVEREVGSGTGAGSSSNGSRGTTPTPGSAGAPAAAAVAAAAGAAPTAAVAVTRPAAKRPAQPATAQLVQPQSQSQQQQQQQRQQQQKPQQEQPQQLQQSQQAAALQQEWQQHLQRQRQQQQQRRKRPAADTVDLTLSDSEGDDEGAAGQAASAGGGPTDGPAISNSCPCCAGLVGCFDGHGAAAEAAAAGVEETEVGSWRSWCARHRQLRQQQQQQHRRQDGRWTCPACTLVNGPLVLQCEACLTVRSSL